jgi:mono/diheme cytochrome c family protein
MTRTAFVAASALAAAAVLSWPSTALPHETVTTTVLFEREIVRILNAHCVMCHVERGPSFPLATYEQVWLAKRKISAEVLARHMPPWAPLPGYGRFANENVVTQRESQFIVSWMEGLGPRNAGRVFTNTAAQAGGPQPAAVQAHIDLDAWQLGQPDLMRELEAVTVEPRRGDDRGDDVDVVRTILDLGGQLSEARRVRAVEYIPGDRRVVRAAFFTVQETGQWIGSWTPWYGFMKLPPEAAFQLPAGAHIAAEVHYHRTGERVVDRGRIGLFFGARASAAPVSDFVVAARKETGVAARNGSRRFQAETVLAADTALLALRPDVVPGLASIEVVARRADGTTDVLLFAKDIPFEWPTPYIFRDPVRLRRGTKVAVTAYTKDGAVVPDGVRITVSGYAPVRPARAQR